MEGGGEEVHVRNQVDKIKFLRRAALTYLEQQLHQRGYKNILNDRTAWRIKYPNAYQPAGPYRRQGKHRHKDSFQRVLNNPQDDQYLSPWDGHLAKLIVQATDAVYDGPENASWRRTFIRNATPLIIRIANWASNSVPQNCRMWSAEDWFQVVMRWFAACIALLFMVWLKTLVFLPESDQRI